MVYPGVNDKTESTKSRTVTTMALIVMMGLIECLRIHMARVGAV